MTAKIATIPIITQIAPSINIQNTYSSPIYFMFKQWLERKLNEETPDEMVRVNQALQTFGQAINIVTDQNLKKQMMDAYGQFANQFAQITRQQPAQNPAAPAQQQQPPPGQQANTPVQAPQMPRVPQTGV